MPHEPERCYVCGCAFGGNAVRIRAKKGAPARHDDGECPPLHVGPANMALACGGREVTNGVTTIRIDQTGQLSGNSE